MPILTVTLNPSIDRVIGDGLPAEGRLFAAGKGVNASRALSRLGAPSTAVALCPDEDRPFFEGQLSDLGPGGIGFVPVPVRGRVRRRVTRTMGRGVAVSDHRPEPGPSGTLELDAADADLDRVRDELLRRITPEKPGVLVAFCGSLPPGASASAFGSLLDAALRAGAEILVDARGEAGLAGLARPIWLGKFNHAELEEVPETATQRARLLAVTLGPAGLTLAAPGALQILAKVTLPEPHRALDDVGCGDAVTAGMLLSWSRNPGNLDQLVRWGVAAGTASAASVGPGELEPKLFKRLASAARALNGITPTLLPRGPQGDARDGDEPHI